MFLRCFHHHAPFKINKNFLQILFYRMSRTTRHNFSARVTPSIKSPQPSPSPSSSSSSSFPSSSASQSSPPPQAQPPKTKNSIAPKNEQGYAYGHYFPKNWSVQYIKSILDPGDREIDLISIVRTQVGEHSGKILIKFKNQKIRQKYIAKYNQDFILTETESQKVVILPFNLRTQQLKKEVKQRINWKNPVKISNLDYDITKHQLNKLAVDYGQVSHIELNQRQNGLNRGFATIYFQQADSAIKFVQFIDGFTYRENKLKAHLVRKAPAVQNKQFLQVPTYTFKANQQLMKKFKSKQHQIL